MKNIFVSLFVFLSSLIAFASANTIKKFSIERKNVDIKVDDKNNPGHVEIDVNGKKRQEFFMGNLDASTLKIDDYNFDGRLDFSFTGDQGIVRFLNVFVYNNRQGLFEKNLTLSEIPCLDIDKKNKLLIGACFHEGSCENWSEKYKVKPLNRLEVVYKERFICDPSTGNGYRFKEFYKSGHLMKRITRKVNE